MIADYDLKDDSGSDPSSGKSVSSLLNTSGATVVQAMGFDLNVTAATESQDTLSFNIGYGCAAPASQINLAGNLATPTGVSSSAELDTAVNISYPLTPDIPYPSATVLGRITDPPLAKHDLVNSWIKWTGAEATAPLAQRLADLGSDANTGSAPNWIQELATTPTAPLPVLSAEASMKALASDGTRFASFGGYRGTGAPLNREWLDGGWNPTYS